jgi:AcrR family transcriptional regulator
MTKPTESEQEGGRRTGQHAARVGGRSARVVRDVLEATTCELARVGYAALRMDEVASNAGVNKTTVYRRWPTKVALVHDALRERAKAIMRAPDTGALRTDLLDLARQVVAHRSVDQGRAIARVMLVEMVQPEVADMVRDLREDWIAPWLVVVRRSIKRGELPPKSDPRLVVEVVIGGVMGRVRRNEPVDDAHLRAVVDLVVLGAQQGGAIVKGTRSRTASRTRTDPPKGPRRR